MFPAIRCPNGFSRYHAAHPARSSSSRSRSRAAGLGAGRNGWDAMLPGYADGSRMEKEFVHLGSPLLEWKWRYNAGPDAESLPWTAAGFDDTAWPTAHVVPEKTKQHEAGTALDRFDGYCKPVRFAVTEALAAGDNKLTILTERHHVNEIGTGGLMGPVVLYRDK